MRAQNQDRSAKPSSTPTTTVGAPSPNVQLKQSLRGMNLGAQTAALAPPADWAPVQARATQLAEDPAAVHSAANHGLGGGGGALPHLAAIQQSFGHHDVSAVQAHTGERATEAAGAMGAQAYASGNHVVFGEGTPDLHTAAHEAAHVVQQKRGVSLSGGVGKSGDSYEQHADHVADQVTQGKSAEALLDGKGAAGPAAEPAGGAVQRAPATKPQQPAKAPQPSKNQATLAALKDRESKLSKLHHHYGKMLKAIDELRSMVQADASSAEWQNFLSSEAMLAFGRFGALGSLFDPTASPTARVSGGARLLAGEITNAAGMDATGSTVLSSLTAFSPADVEVLTSTQSTLDKAKGLVGWAFTIQSVIGAWKVQAQNKQLDSIKGDLDQIISRKAELVHEMSKIGTERSKLNAEIKKLSK